MILDYFTVYSSYSIVSLGLLAVMGLRWLHLRLYSHPITHLPGPPQGSWLVGNIPDLVRPESVGDADFQWTKELGTSLHIKGPFGRDILFTSDPKALQYILNTSGYRYPKSPDMRFLLRMVTGKGIVWADGEQHVKHKKIMGPAFTYNSVRGFIPFFRETAQRTVAKWEEIVAQNADGSSVVDIPSWLARFSLDSMGCVLDYDFGALSGGSSKELSEAYKDLFADTLYNRSDLTLAFQDLCGYLPEWMVHVLQSVPSKHVKRLRDYMQTALSVAQSLVDRQLKSQDSGGVDGKDLMSLLVKANTSKDTKRKLGNDELLAQLTTLLLAGHETIASSVTWMLYELSRHQSYQDQVRAEIKAARNQVAQRGDNQLSPEDLDSLKYLQSLIKETLRYHPTLPHLVRVAGGDDFLPLTVPQRTTKGDVITGIPVSKGQRIILSIAAYNRLPCVWGEDSDVWRPERFLEDKASQEKTGLGVFANLATFSSGIRSCIGWRFALLEMQVLLVELIEHFNFSPPPGNVEIVRAAASLMTPMIKGSDMGSTELPLTITSVL